MQEASVVREYRIPLPLKPEEYQIGQLWSIAEVSKNETGGCEGIEVVCSIPFSNEVGPQPREPLQADGKTFTSGQYTEKIYHVSSKVPAYIRMLAPRGSLELHERSWNAYPYVRTEITNREYMKEKFYIIIDSYYASDNGTSDNIHGLTGKELEKREVVPVDIANDKIAAKDYNLAWDPTKVRSEKAGRGPLVPDEEGSWKNNVEPVMCCYKVVKAVFVWWGLQPRIERMIMHNSYRLFVDFNRQVVCWLDKYYDLTMEDIRRIEDETKEELGKNLRTGEVRGAIAFIA